MTRTNIVLDDRLVKEAGRLTHLTTKKDIVNFALKELVRKRRRKGLLKLEGAVAWQGSLAEMRKGRT